MRILTGLCASMLLAASAQAELIAYWDQNSNDLPGGGFGFTPSDFPQAADQGAGSLTLVDFDTTTGGVDGAYTTIQSFGGTTENAQPTIASGGSLSPQGGVDNGGVFSNNGMGVVIQVDTSLYTDIAVSWAQRGTSSGFTSREFSYSTDGVNYTSFGTDTGVLSSTWTTTSYDLSAIDGLEGQSAAYFKITLDGATGSTGNNRFDNITVTGTLVPEPGTVVLALLSLASAGAVTMRKRLG